MLSNLSKFLTSLCETVPENVAEDSSLDLPFNDDYNIATPEFKSMMNEYTEL